jgi:methionyl-tRNA synthetase
MHPYLPFSSEKLHGLLAEPGTVRSAGWRRSSVVPGRALPPPVALFKKLDSSIVEEEVARLHGAEPVRA